TENGERFPFRRVSGAGEQVQGRIGAPDPWRTKMAREKAERNGRLEEAMAMLIQNQAAFLARVAETDRQLAEMQRINSERFARIEAIRMEHSRFLAEHSQILADHTRIL